MRAAFSSNPSDRVKFIEREVQLFSYVSFSSLTSRYRLKLLTGKEKSKQNGKDVLQKNMSEKEKMILEKLGVHMTMVEQAEMTQLFKKCPHVKECDYFAVDFEKATLLVP